MEKARHSPAFCPLLLFFFFSTRLDTTSNVTVLVGREHWLDSTYYQPLDSGICTKNTNQTNRGSGKEKGKPREEIRRVAEMVTNSFQEG